jgi:acyl transferase domain-containing protein/NADPH:quinone reductase-like Zn-dependent oxidoreductase/acyl carrier protein
MGKADGTTRITTRRGGSLEQIAIVGIGCRLPGNSEGPDAYWQNLLAGRDLISETPADRWNLNAYHAIDPAAAGRTYTRWGGFVSRPDEFDAGFFGIAPREALRMDPQQRWLLETTWEALEDAGYPPANLAGSNVGVFVGISGSDYGDVQKRSRFDVDAYTNSGNALSIAANRISYSFDFRGPSFAVDTACSSSLVALDLACQALSRGDVPVAIVGGANSLFTPDLTIGFSKASMLSPDGRCKPFDAAANGYVRAEGAVSMVLRPLDKALANGDRIYAVIRATCMNQDGRTGSMTVPSVDQQMRLLHEVYARSGISPAQVSYVEAHGTGTPVGDPIEATALGRVLGRSGSRDEPLWIGSVKSNLGHLEPASGVAGLAKLALALHHRAIPPSLHFRSPNPEIAFEALQLAVPTRVLEWGARTTADLLCAGINSFGFGGTNAHAVLTSAPRSKRGDTPSMIAPPYLWTVSARSKEALREAVTRDATFLRDTAKGLGELAATVQRRRSHHPHRLVIVADDTNEAARRLAEWTGESDVRETMAGHAREDASDIVFVFSGQGGQWPGMGRELFEQVPLVRATVERFDALMRPKWGHSLAERFVAHDDSIFQSDVGQPVLFALQVALARLLQAWGVVPACILGHSLGEIAAAHIAGALSEQDVADLIVERSRAQERTRGAWRMAAIGVSEDEARELLAPYRGAIHIAAVNAPTQVTLAGEALAVEELAATLTERGRFARVLPLPYAFHSPAMDTVRDDFLSVVSHVVARAATVPYLSTVTGGELPGEALGPDYWWRNLRQPVQFAAAVRTAIGWGHRTFLEIGPSASLVRYIDEILAAEHVAGMAIGTLKRDAPAMRCVLGSIAKLHVRGVAVQWERLSTDDASHQPFPTYPWQRQRFWAESPDARALRLSGPSHPLLGTRKRGANPAWLSDIGPHTHAFLGDHRLDDRAVFPAAGYVELMLAAVAQSSKESALELSDVRFERLLWLDQAELVETAIDERARTVEICAKPATGEAEWLRHAGAHGRVIDGHAANMQTVCIPKDAREIDVDALYARFARSGHGYGQAFRTIRWARAAGAEFWGRIALDADVGEGQWPGQWHLHPAILDGALQLALASVPVDEEREAKFLPVHIERVLWLRRANGEVLCRVSNVHHQDVRSYADIELFTPAGEPVAAMYGSCCLRKEQAYRLASSPASLYSEEWAETDSVSARIGRDGEAWVVCGDSADGVVAVMTAAGLRAVPCGFTKVPPDTEHIIVCTWTAEHIEPSTATVLDTDWPLVQLAQSLAAHPRPVQLVLVTAGATWGQPGTDARVDLQQATLAALLRTMATELPQVQCRLLDLDPATSEQHVTQTLRELRSDADEAEVSYRGGRRFAQRIGLKPLHELSPRLLPARRTLRADFHLESAGPGSVDELHWVESPAAPLGEGEVEIEVRAAGLNFRDVLKSLDHYPLNATEPRTFGDECAGIVRRVAPGVTSVAPGEAVVAVAPGCIGSRVRVHSLLVAPKPARLTFEEAASIPIAFLTAEYALNDLARLTAGETVLIHAAAGGVGLAAVQVAQRCGATVLGTASPEKHHFLLQSGVAQAFHSRELSFVDGVRAATGGQGVDVVLNSLSGEFLERSLELLKPLGRFIEIGKKDIFANEALHLHAFRAARSFHAVDLAQVVSTRPTWIRERLAKVLKDFAEGSYRPMPHVTFACSRIVDAFRLMAQGKHVGKIVITFEERARLQSIRAAHPAPIRSDATYVITGGLTGFGWATAEWLVAQGARTLVLVSRTASPRPPVAAILEEWRKQGIEVRVVRCDVADPASVHALFESLAEELPPVCGVFHSAMVLHDELLATAGRDAFAQVLAPKAQGAWNLHRETAPLDLDHFVLYSSCATLLGSPGQASYVAANRFAEALAALRRSHGLPAMAIGWGPLADFGVVSERTALARYVENVGLVGLARDTVFAWLKFLLRRDVESVFVLQADWSRYGEANPTARSSDRFAALMNPRQQSHIEDELPRQLAAVAPSERLAIVSASLRRMIAAVLGADGATIDADTPLANLGLDSLMAFELKVKIEGELGVALPLDRLAAGDSLHQLALLLVAQFEQGASDPTTEQARPSPAIALEDDREFFRIVAKSSASALEALPLDAAALTYLPDKLHTIGGLSDAQMEGLFGHEPFVSNYFETAFGRIGAVTLPVRSGALFAGDGARDLILQGLSLASRRAARCVSLTGLIPSATGYGAAIEAWGHGADGLELTTGHATTTAAVVQTLDHAMRLSRRALERERVAVLGLGSIGQSCVRLMLTVLPHPRELVLCDLFTKEAALRAFAHVLRTEHRFRGRIRVAHSPVGVPDEVYAADTVIAAVSVSELVDVDRLRPGTIVVDDSYPPAFTLSRAIRRIEDRADILFSNAGMLRLPRPVRETLVLPYGAEAALEAFGVAAFRDEVARDARELTACVLSSALTASRPGFRSTIGLAKLDDLVSHYRGLEDAGVSAARLQCENYFVPDSLIARFAERFGALSEQSAAD